MLRLLCAIVMSSTVAVPQHKLSPAQARAVEGQVIEDLVPSEGKLEGRPINGRRLIIDEMAISTAMAAVTDGAPPMGLSISRGYKVLEKAQAIKCVRPHTGCQVTDDGVYVAISDAAFIISSGELRIHGLVRWTSPSPLLHELNGFDVDLYFTHSAVGWRLTRHGYYISG